MDKFSAKSILEQSEFFLYFPKEYPGTDIDVMGFYFRDVDLGLSAIQYITECVTADFITLDFVVANPNKLNIFIKNADGQLITYALDIYANDAVIAQLQLTQNRSHLRKSTLVIFRTNPDDNSFVLHTLSNDDGDAPEFLSVSRFGCTSK